MSGILEPSSGEFQRDQVNKIKLICSNYARGNKTPDETNQAVREIIGMITADQNLMEIEFSFDCFADTMRSVLSAEDSKMLALAVMQELVIVESPQLSRNGMIGELITSIGGKLKAIGLHDVAIASSLLIERKPAPASVNDAAYRFSEHRRLLAKDGKKPPYDPVEYPTMGCTIDGKRLGQLYMEAGDDASKLAVLDRLYAEREIVLIGQAPMFSNASDAKLAKEALEKQFNSIEFSLQEVGGQFGLFPCVKQQ